MKARIWVSICAAVVFGLTSAAIADTTVRGDLDGDADVDAIDFAIWQQAYVSNTAEGDLDADLDTDGDDFLVWQAGFGRGLVEGSSGGGGLASVSAVPEPSSVALLSASLLLLAGARRNRQ